MKRTALLSMLLAMMANVKSTDVPRPDLTGAQTPVVARMKETANAVEASPQSAEAWGLYAMVLHAHNCSREADIAYSQARRIAPREVRWVYFRGVLLLKSNPSKGLEYIDQAIRLDPTYGPAHIRRGLALEALDRDEEAWQAYSEALRLQPHNISAHLHMGQLEIKRNDLEAAVRHLETARTSRPQDSAVLSSLARAYSRQGDRIRARELAEAARNNRPGRVIDDRRFNEVVNQAVTLQAFIQRSEVYFKAGNNNKALGELERALKLGHDAGSVYAALARLYLKLAEYNKCVEACRTSIASGHERDGLYLVMGAGLYYTRQFDKAEKAISHALDAQPSDPVAMRLYGRIAAARGDDTEAIIRWSKAFEIADDAATHRERAKARSRLGQHDKAISELNALLSTAQEKAATWLALGEVYRDAGNLDAALSSFERAAENASVPFAGRQATSVLIAQQRFIEARLRLRDLRKQWPRNTNLMNDLAWLLATCPDEKVRNGTEALAIIQPLVQQTQRKEPSLLDTLAAALAEVGRFSEATATMDQVLALLPDETPPNKRRTSYQIRRDHYARRKAWRDGS